jgi:hypothetical protein
MASGELTFCLRCERGVLEVVFKDTIPSSPRLTNKIVICLVTISGSTEGIHTGYLFNKRNKIQDRFDKYLDPLQKTNQEALPTCSSETNSGEHLSKIYAKKNM